jgi:hypothetical protein
MQLPARDHGEVRQQLVHEGQELDAALARGGL